MDSDAVRGTYDRRARWYDSIVRLLSFGGDAAYRRAAIAELRLRPGHRVLDVGCGTGLNFRWLADAVGPEGMVVGADLSRSMLLRSREPRARRVQAAASQTAFKAGSFDAAISTYLISTLLGEGAIEPLARSVRPGGRVVVVDDSLPPGWFVGPRFMAANLRRRGWPDLRRDTVHGLRPYVTNLRVRFCHFGMIYIISGDRA